MISQRWIVSYHYNGKRHEKSFEFYITALAEWIKLDAYGINASISENF